MDVKNVNLEPRTIFGVHQVIPMSGMTEFFGRAFATALAELRTQGSFPAGPPVALYHGTPTDTVDVTAGFPVVRSVRPSAGEVEVGLPGGPAVETIHVGSYETLPDTYRELSEWLADHHLTATDDMWEEYLVGPGMEPDPAKWQTRVVYPLAS